MKKVVNEGTGQGTSSDNTFLLNEEIRYFYFFSKFVLERERNITHCRMLLILNSLSWHKQHASITGGDCQLYGCQGISECESTAGTP